MKCLALNLLALSLTRFFLFFYFYLYALVWLSCLRKNVDQVKVLLTRTFTQIRWHQSHGALYPWRKCSNAKRCWGTCGKSRHVRAITWRRRAGSRGGVLEEPVSVESPVLSWAWWQLKLIIICHLQLEVTFPPGFDRIRENFLQHYWGITQWKNWL